MLNKKRSVYDNNKDGKDWKVLFKARLIKKRKSKHQLIEDMKMETFQNVDIGDADNA